MRLERGSDTRSAAKAASRVVRAPRCDLETNSAPFAITLRNRMYACVYVRACGVRCSHFEVLRPE